MSQSETKSSSWIPETGDHIPEDKDKRLVQTPYGQGVVRRTRVDKLSEVELLDWVAGTEGQPRRKPTTLYTPTASLTSIQPTVGCDVLCFAGRGRVTEIQAMESDTKLPPKVTVLLSSWRLANRSRVKCYLNPSQVQVVRLKRIYEMTVYEKIDYAFALKETATGFFKQGEYLKALEEYTRAVGTVKYVQHAKEGSPNSLRADLLVVMITCSNNAGTCSIKLGHHADRSVEFAKQALDLIQAMETKKGSKIHAELVKSGYSDDKVFGEWKVKACLILANGLSTKGNVEAALEALKTARTTIHAFSSNHVLERNEREVLKRMAALKEQRKAQISKERRRAKAMFATETDNDATAASATTTTTTTTPSQKPSSDVPLESERKTHNREKRHIDRSRSTDWFQSPMVLGSLGIVAGVAGTILIYSQLFHRKQRS